MSLVALEVYQDLFASKEAMAKFAVVLEQATEDDDTPLVMFGHRHIATALSPQASERLLSDRILKRFAEKPGLLENFVQKLDGLKESDIVE